MITTVAGNGTAGYSGDGGQATAAELDYPTGVAVDAAGDLFIADTGNNRIREVNHATGVITTVAGNGTCGLQRRRRPGHRRRARPSRGRGRGHRRGPLHRRHRQRPDPRGEPFHRRDHHRRRQRSRGLQRRRRPGHRRRTLRPEGVAVDAAGDLFIADTDNNRIREVLATSATVDVAKATPAVSVTDAGGTYNGSAFPATATVAGVVAWRGHNAGRQPRSAFPTLTYYSGSNSATGTGTATVPSVRGTYTVVASFPAVARLCRNPGVYDVCH